GLYNFVQDKNFSRRNPEAQNVDFPSPARSRVQVCSALFRIKNSSEENGPARQLPNSLAPVRCLRMILPNMFSSDVASALRKGLFCFLTALFISAAIAGEHAAPVPKNQPKVAAASSEGEDAIRSLKLPPGFKAELIAAEPHLANPVAFHIDEHGR